MYSISSFIYNKKKKLSTFVEKKDNYDEEFNFFLLTFTVLPDLIANSVAVMRPFSYSSTSSRSFSSILSYNVLSLVVNRNMLMNNRCYQDMNKG